MQVNINDFLQLDELIEHAQLHKEKYGDNLIVFISKHYGELKSEHEKNNKDEKKEHEQLPFHKQSNINLILVFTLNFKNVDNQKIICPESKDAFFYNQSLNSSLHEKGIFQPPKQA